MDYAFDAREELPYLLKVLGQIDLSKQCRPRSDAT